MASACLFSPVCKVPIKLSEAEHLVTIAASACSEALREEVERKDVNQDERRMLVRLVRMYADSPDVEGYARFLREASETRGVKGALVTELPRLKALFVANIEAARRAKGRSAYTWTYGARNALQINKVQIRKGFSSRVWGSFDKYHRLGGTNSHDSDLSQATIYMPRWTAARGEADPGADDSPVGFKPELVFNSSQFTGDKLDEIVRAVEFVVNMYEAAFPMRGLCEVYEKVTGDLPPAERANDPMWMAKRIVGMEERDPRVRKRKREAKDRLVLLASAVRVASIFGHDLEEDLSIQDMNNVEKAMQDDRNRAFINRVVRTARKSLKGFLSCDPDPMGMLYSI